MILEATQPEYQELEVAPPGSATYMFDCGCVLDFDEQLVTVMVCEEHTGRNEWNLDEAVKVCQAFVEVDDQVVTCTAQADHEGEHVGILTWSDPV